MSKGLPIYAGIGHIVEGWLGPAIQAAPVYRQQFASAVQMIQRCIHGLKRMHPAGDLARLEVYLGRATRATLQQRWASHAKRKGHEFGAIAFRCDPNIVECLEDVAIKILKKLDVNHALCVGNANVFPGSVGRRRDEEALVYMTWRTLPKRCRVGRPSPTEVGTIASEVHRETPHKGQITRGQILRGMRIVRCRSTSRKLCWWTPAYK
ncbi:MAG: hypothetical protein ABL970_02080 [Nitrospira sp.]